MSVALPLYRDGKAYYAGLTFWIDNDKLMAKEAHSAPYEVDWGYVEAEYAPTFHLIDATLRGTATNFQKMPHHQITLAFHRWCQEGKYRGLRFGQWFMNTYKIGGHNEIYNMLDPKLALEAVMKEFGCPDTWEEPKA